MSKLTPAVWQAIELRWLAGESAYSIAKGLPVSKTAILKRAKRDGWQREANGIVSDRHRGGFPDLGQDCPANRQRVLELLQAGGSFTVAAMTIGISTGVLLSWRKSDPAFEAQCTAARGHSLHKAEATIAQHSEKDWKAAKTRLAAAEETRDQYAPTVAGGPKLEIFINIDRGSEAPVDVTPRRRFEVIEGRVVEPPVMPNASDGNAHIESEPPAVEQSRTDTGLLAEPPHLTQGERIALAEKRRATEAEERAALEKRLTAEYEPPSRWDGSLS